MRLLLLTILSLATAGRIFPQAHPFTLAGRHVTTLQAFQGKLYAGTKDSGVHVFTPDDPTSASLGLQNLWITSLRVSDDGGPEPGLRAGIRKSGAPGDSSLIHRYTGGVWLPDDAGIDTQMWAINSIMPAMGLETTPFAVGETGPVYRRDGSGWVPGEPSSINGLRLWSPRADELWISGQNGWGDPVLLKSTDLGVTWVNLQDTILLQPGYVYSLLFPDTTSPALFAGGNGRIWRYDGLSWDSTLGAECIFEAMAVDPFDPDMIFAGGGDDSGNGRLFRSTDGGASWDSLSMPDGPGSITALEVIVRDSLELYIATAGDGVYRYTQPSGTAGLSVQSGWNLLSVPRTMGDYSAAALFPDATSAMFAWGTAYEKKDTADNGAGYWVKFASARTIPFEGPSFVTDTVEVRAGWNIVGSLSHPIPADSVTSIPPGIVVSDYFGYEAGYSPAATLVPGRGYWVKVSQAGQLVLSKP